MMSPPRRGARCPGLSSWLGGTARASPECSGPFILRIAHRLLTDGLILIELHSYANSELQHLSILVNEYVLFFWQVPHRSVLKCGPMVPHSRHCFHF